MAQYACMRLQMQQCFERLCDAARIGVTGDDGARPFDVLVRVAHGNGDVCHPGIPHPLTFRIEAAANLYALTGEARFAGGVRLDCERQLRTALVWRIPFVRALSRRHAPLADVPSSLNKA